MKKGYLWMISISIVLLFAYMVYIPDEGKTVNNNGQVEENKGDSWTAMKQTSPNWKPVQNIFKEEGSLIENSIKFTFPRYDLNVKVGEVTVDPHLALTSWMVFMPMGNQAMVMGDLVLVDEEVKPVLSKLVDNGIHATAIHNHLIKEEPSITFVHFSGKGKATDLARTLKETLALTKTPLTAPKIEKAIETPKWQTIETILGEEGKRSANVLHFSFPRNETITDTGMDVHGVIIPPYFGTSTVINFQGANDKVVAYGDFVLLPGEVDEVVEILTKNGITVTAIHNHMLFEEPRLIFLHFWGYDKPQKLAQALDEALGKTNVKH